MPELITKSDNFLTKSLILRKTVPHSGTKLFAVMRHKSTSLLWRWNWLPQYSNIAAHVGPTSKWFSASKCAVLTKVLSWRYYNVYTFYFLKLYLMVLSSFVYFYPQQLVQWCLFKLPVPRPLVPNKTVISNLFGTGCLSRDRTTVRWLIALLTSPYFISSSH